MRGLNIAVVPETQPELIRPAIVNQEHIRGQLITKVVQQIHIRVTAKGHRHQAIVVQEAMEGIVVAIPIRPLPVRTVQGIRTEEVRTDRRIPLRVVAGNLTPLATVAPRPVAVALVVAVLPAEVAEDADKISF